MSLRNLVIALVAIVAGVGAAFLLLTAGVVLGQAVLGGFTAFGATMYFVDSIVE